MKCVNRGVIAKKWVNFKIKIYFMWPISLNGKEKVNLTTLPSFSDKDN